jgi:ribbon-helix-helix protein
MESRAAAVNDTVAHRTLTLGTQHLSRRDLEELRDAGQMVELRVLGLATVADDIALELALATIALVEVLGAFRAPRTVKAALAPHTTT